METPYTFLEYLQIALKDNRDVRELYLKYQEAKRTGKDIESFVPALMQHNQEIDQVLRYLVDYISNGGSLNG
jgi:GTP cyclohydrolase III